MQVARSAPLLIVTAATTLMGAFDTWALTASAPQSAVGGCIGLAWGLLLSVLMRWLKLREMPLAVNAAIFLTCLVSGMLLGVGLTFETYLTTALSAKPSLVPALIRPPVGPWVNLPFIVFNTLLEWLLLPVCLLVNWDTPQRRRLVIAAAIAFYPMRIWSYVYFIPVILAWSSVLPERAPPEILVQIGQWASLSWVRLAIDGLVNVLFLLAAFVPPSSDARTSGLA